MLRIAINGFGRIGRMFLRSLVENPVNNIKVVAINDVANLHQVTHLFKYDSTHGPFKGEVLLDRNYLDVGLGPIEILSQLDAEKLPWQEMQIDLVVECSGRFKDKTRASKHISAGAKRVLISTITDGADQTVIYGINHQQLKSIHRIISNASCTSNCLLAVMHPLNNALNIECGNMLSVHAYTSDQCIIDAAHSDLYRSRAVGSSLILTSTNASKAISLIMPELTNKIHCTAVRVPIINVSMIDFNFISRNKTTKEDINQIIVNVSNSYLKGVLGWTDEPLVSIDFNHDPRSAIVDLNQTNVTNNHMCRVVAWYDNEWGYANRMRDVVNYMSYNF